MILECCCVKQICIYLLFYFSKVTVTLHFFREIKSRKNFLYSHSSWKKFFLRYFCVLKSLLEDDLFSYIAIDFFFVMLPWLLTWYRQYMSGASLKERLADSKCGSIYRKTKITTPLEL